MLFGSRHLVTRFVPAVGEFVAFPGSAGDLVRGWIGGHRPVGLGADASAPTLVGVAGGLGAVLGGHLALARTLLVVGLVPVGVVGAYRLLRPTGSKPAQVAAAVAYAAVPLPYDGLATGRWSVAAAYAASPWLLGRLARSSRMAPYSPDGPVPAVPRPLWQHVVATGAVTGVAALLVPQAAALLLLVALGLVAGTLLAFQRGGIGRLVTVSVGAALLATLLHLPALVDVIRSRTAADAWMGLERPAGALTALDLLRFDTGHLGIAPLGFCLAGAAALPLLVGRDWRLGWAVRAWAVAVACWALLWAQQQGHVHLRLPDPGIVLAPAAAALAFAVALGVAAIELDVRGRSWRFGFRRMVSALGVLALAAATAPVVVAAMDGWWDMPPGQFGGVMGTADAAVAAEPSRVLWVGDAAVLPGGQAWELDGGLSYTAVEASVPGVADLWPATGLGSSRRLGEALLLATGGQTSKLGRVLAPMGVQYVAVPRALAPASAVERTGGGSGGPGSAALAPPGAVDGLIEALDGQLDLEQIAVDDALALYRNVAFAPMRATGIDRPALEETSVAAMQHVDLSRAAPALVESDGDGRTARGPVEAGDTVVQASSASDRWALEVDGRRADRTDAYGWADAFAVPEGVGPGEAVLGYRTPPVRYALVAVQGMFWLLVLAVTVRMRFGSAAPSPPSRPDKCRRVDGRRSGRWRGGTRRARARRRTVPRGRAGAGGGGIPGVKRPHLRRRSPRLPVIVLLAAAIGAAVWQARAEEDRGSALANTSDDDAAAGSVPAMPAVASAGAQASTWYCAAGTGDEGGMADHSVTVFNPGDRSVGVTVTVYGGVLASSSPTTAEAPEAPPASAAAPAAGARGFRLPGRERVELRLGDIVAAPLVAALVEADGGPVAVEHGVTGPHGVDVGPCASATAPVWHLASGATTRDAREVVVLFNPFPTDAIVDITFETDAGSREPVRFQGFPVAAGTVVGVDVGDDVAREPQVSATLRTRTGRVVAERLQEFDGSLGAEGLAVALGVPGASTTWAFADGAVDDGGAERIVVYNPSGERAQVEVRVLPTTDEPSPAPQPFRLSIRAGAFTVVDYGAEERVVAGVEHATVVRSTNGVAVVAERVMTHAGEPDDRDDDDGGDEDEDQAEAEVVGDITASPAASVAASRWVFPSSVDGQPGAQFVVFNPDAERSARVTLVAVAGGRQTEVDDARDVEVPPRGRAALGDDAAGVTWVVEAEAPVVVERVLVEEGGVHLAAGVGIPSIDGSVSLGRLVGR